MVKKWDGPHPERMKKPWNCCQDCGRELDKDRDDVFGEFVGDARAVEDVNGRPMKYIYAHRKGCP